MNIPTLNFDICVLGAGPAGATISNRLSLLGFSVAIVEKQVFPRSHVGESLTQGIFHAIQLLGIAEQDWNKIIVPAKALVNWSTPGTVLHQERNDFLTDRSIFDQYLLQLAEHQGVIPFIPAIVSEISFGEDQKWDLRISRSKEEIKIKADFLVDATGKTSFLTTKKIQSSASTLCLYAHWRANSYKKWDTLVEAGCNHWYWAANLPDESLNIMVFVDPKSLNSKSKEGLTKIYLNLINQSESLREVIRSQPFPVVKAINSSSYYAKEIVTANYIKVGEAAFSIDPLSSQGVQVAVMSAYQGSIIVNTILKKPENTDIALEFYKSQVEKAIYRNKKWTAKIYASQNIYELSQFWKIRSQEYNSVKNNEKTSSNITPSIVVEKDMPLFKYKTEIGLFPSIKDNFIKSELGISAQMLEEPLIYLGSHNIVQLFILVQNGDKPSQILNNWKDVIKIDVGVKILHWFITNQILKSE